MCTDGTHNTVISEIHACWLQQPYLIKYKRKKYTALNSHFPEISV